MEKQRKKKANMHPYAQSEELCFMIEQVGPILNICFSAYPRLLLSQFLFCTVTIRYCVPPRPWEWLMGYMPITHLSFITNGQNTSHLTPSSKEKYHFCLPFCVNTHPSYCENRHTSVSQSILVLIKSTYYTLK